MVKAFYLAFREKSGKGVVCCSLERAEEIKPNTSKILNGVYLKIN